MATKQELQDAKIVTDGIVVEIKDYIDNGLSDFNNFIDKNFYISNLNGYKLSGENNGYDGTYRLVLSSLEDTINNNKQTNTFGFAEFKEGERAGQIAFVRCGFQYFDNNVKQTKQINLVHIDMLNDFYKKSEVDNLISNSSGSSLLIYSLSNNGGTEVQSSISQGDNSIGFNYQKNMNNELPKYININFNGEYNNDYFALATTAYVNDAVSNIQGGAGSVTQATDTTLGTIKLNPNESINVNSDGQLTVGGRIGQFEGTTGLFAPNDREPRQVGDYSLLITDAKGMDIANRAFALVSGYGLACKSAAAGTTQYRITNNYANRIIAKMCEGGYVALNEESSKASKIIPVVSVTINGSPFTPDSSANSSNDIIITTEETLNPDSAITNIRLFGKMQAYATVHTGNGVASWGGGRNLILGGAVTKAGSANDNCLVGMNIYSSGNGNACFGRQHIATKNRGFLAGTGHDTTGAKSEAVSAVGEYSYIDSNTLFAVGNGTSHTARSNAFEVTNNGIILKSPNGTRFRISVTDTGELIAAEP